MPYKSYPATEVKKMCEDCKKLAVELDKLKKAKGDKVKIKSMEKAVEDKAKEIGKKMETDMTAVGASFSAHAIKVDQTLGALMKEHKAGEEALKAFAAKPNMRENSQNFVRASQAAEKMRVILQAIQTDADEYGKSWFEYRGFNATSASGADKKYFAKANSMVGKLMDGQKTLSSKLVKMDALVKQGAALGDRARTAANAGIGMAEAGKKEAVKLADTTTAIVNEMDNGKRVNVRQVRSAENSIKGVHDNTPKPTVDHVRNCESILQNAIAGYKFLQTSWRSIEKMVKDAKPTLGKSTDGEVVASLKTALDNEKKAKEYYDEATAITKRLVPLIAQLKAKAKKAGAKV